MPRIYPAPRTHNIIVGGEAGFDGYARAFYKAYKYLPKLSICIDDGGKPGALITNLISDLHFCPQTQAFPLYYYERVDVESVQRDGAGAQGAMSVSDGALTSHMPESEMIKGSSAGGECAYYKRKDAIRDEALRRFQEVYKDSTISKEAMFYYIYALLNHLVYKTKFADNLSKMLPRIPFMQDFWGFERAGRALSKIHLDYEGFAPDYLTLDSQSEISQPSQDHSEASLDSPFVVLRKDIDSMHEAFSRARSKGLFVPDDRERLSTLKTQARQALVSLPDSAFQITKIQISKGRKGGYDGDTILFNDTLAIVNVPKKAYEYIINGKSAIGWILDRYKYSIDKDSKIVNDPNLYESEQGALKGLKGGRYVLALLLSVIEMSVKNQEIIESLPEYKLLETESLSS